MKKHYIGCILLFLPFLLSAAIGGIVAEYALPMDQPYGLALDGNNLLISDRASGQLFFFSLEKKKITGSQALPCEHPLGIVSDGRGLWVSDSQNQRIFHFLPKAQRVDRVLMDLETNPTGLGWDGTNLWATSRKIFVKLDASDGTEVQTFEGPGNDTTAVFCDGDYLWLTERIKDRIVCATKDGEIFAVLPSPGPYPTGICRQGDLLWIIDFEKRTLYAMDIAFNSQPFYLGEAHRREVCFTHALFNRGPSSDVQGKLYFCVGEDDFHQKLIKPLAFDRTDVVFKNDNWDQKFAVVEGNIPAQKSLSLGYTVQVETRNLNYFIMPEWVQPLEKIPAEIKAKYLVDGHKLQTKDPYIRQLLKTIIGDERNPFWIAFKIHRWLHLNIEYQMTGGWNAAPTVLKRGTGSCSEFTFSFIALARAAGLPARYESGLVVRGDEGSIDDVYHRWVQVYLPPFGWVAVDPSRGKPASAMDVALSFGSLSERFFITTHSGGDSPLLGWTYNSNAFYEFSGKAVVENRTEAKWNPLPKQ